VSYRGYGPDLSLPYKVIFRDPLEYAVESIPIICPPFSHSVGKLILRSYKDWS